MSSADPQPCVFVIDVGYTTVRPIIPDQHVRRIVLAWPSDDPAAATCRAAQWVKTSVGNCEMPTSTRIVDAYV